MANRVSLLLALLPLLQVACGDRTSISGARDSGARDAAAPDAADAATGDAFTPDLAPVSDAVTADLAADSVPDFVSRPDGAPDALPDLPSFSDTGASLDAPLLDARADLPLDLVDLAREVGADLPSNVDGPASVFCSGEAPRLTINGTTSSPTVAGKMIPFDCCDGGEFDVTTPSFSLPIVFTWRRMVSAGFAYPVSVDLANLPSAWAVQLYAGCNPISSSCTTGSDWYSSGMQGTLLVARAASQFDMSLCLHVQESPDSPHTIVHSMDLYAPHVRTVY